MFETAFAEGLGIGLNIFQFELPDVRIPNIEKKVSQVIDADVDKLSSELRQFRKLLNNRSKFRRAYVENEARRFLGSVIENATAEDILALVSFIMSVGTYIKTIDIIGTTAIGFYGDHMDVTLSIKNFSNEKEILETILRLNSFNSINGVQIDTASISSAVDMKAIGIVTISFCKILEMLGKQIMAISDQLPKGNEALITIQFQGLHDMNYLTENSFSSSTISHPLRAVYKNVYVLGRSGVGKSTLGNMIAGEDIFLTDLSPEKKLVPQHCDISSSHSESFRLWDMPGLYDGGAYARSNGIVYVGNNKK